MQSKINQQQNYLKAKKRVDEIKGFYIHLLVFVLVIPIIILVNLTFVPQFYFFWFALLGWGIGISLHWLGVFGFKLLGFGKDWEERKIKELMNENK